ncbi:hypothetical protein Bca101_023337 [Brassica carinata]
MAAQIPIGTRGTIGSLVRKEIDYFKNFNTCPRTKWSKKKKRQSCGGRGAFLPSMCSAVEVSGENQVPGFNYRILKNDEKGLRA